MRMIFIESVHVFFIKTKLHWNHAERSEAEKKCTCSGNIIWGNIVGKIIWEFNF
jgi:hypothetical protein